MGFEAIGVFLQGVGSILLAAVTAVIGWRAAGALRIRIEGMSLAATLAVPDHAALAADEFQDAA